MKEGAKRCCAHSVPPLCPFWVSDTRKLLVGAVGFEPTTSTV